MEIVFSQIDDTAARFQLCNASTSFANAFRRAMVSEVPTLAIEDIRIYDNTSALFDEVLAHRIGLIPIKTDLDSYVQRELCACNGEGCAGCTATFTMSVEGPAVVCSGDLIPQDPGTVPAYDSIPIVKLVEGQKLVIEAHAFLSTGKEHAKWQPTTACGYKNHPHIEISDPCDGCGMCVDECPRGILENSGGRVSVVEGRLEYCSLCRLCERACIGSGIGEESAIRITEEADRFIFTLESDGSLPAGEIIRQGFLFMKSRSENLIEKLGEISGGTGHEENEE